MVSRTTSWLKAIARNWGFRLGFAIAPSMLLGLVIPEMGCGGTESWCIDSGGCGDYSEATCQGTPGCTWAPYCDQIACGGGQISQVECAARTGCKWDMLGSSCLPDASVAQCGANLDNQACATHSYCEWITGCIVKSSVNCRDANSQTNCEAVGRCKWVTSGHTTLG